MDTRTGEIFNFDTKEDLWKAMEENKFLKEMDRELTTLEKSTGKIGRNNPCGCGSNKKFKKCCWTGRYPKNK